MLELSTQTIVQQFAALRRAGGFPVILADPAWQHDTWSKKGADRSPQAHYQTMTLDQICAMPVHLLGADDCTLFMWCRWPQMPIWTRVIEAWGFNFAGLAWEWIKYNPDTGKYAFGNGYGSRKNVEPCLMATRGNPSLRKGWGTNLFDEGFAPKGVHSVRDFIEWNPVTCIRSPRREHSRKPPEQYKRIETLLDGPYLELFARHTRPNWTAWGNEADKFLESRGEA